MKEIKFKAKDINDNWVSGQYVYDERNKIHHIVDGNVYYKIKRKTICQYITTRNRIELYEGDLLVDRYPIDDLSDEMAESLLPIIWVESELQWCVDTSFKKDGSHYCPIIDFFGNHIEVKGNIHD